VSRVNCQVVFMRVRSGALRRGLPPRWMTRRGRTARGFIGRGLRKQAGFSRAGRAPRIEAVPAGQAEQLAATIAGIGRCALTIPS